jgi:hypothetical protein
MARRVLRGLLNYLCARTNTQMIRSMRSASGRLWRRPIGANSLVSQRSHHALFRNYNKILVVCATLYT